MRIRPSKTTPPWSRRSSLGEFAYRRRAPRNACASSNSADRESLRAGQKRSIKRGSDARGVQRDRLDLDAHDLSLLRFLEHRVERVRLGPAVYRRMDSACNGSRLRWFVRTCEN